MKQVFTNKSNIVSLVLFLVFYNTFAQLALVSNQNIDFSTAVTTVSSGNWSNPSIWSSGVVPDATTDVIISDNHTVYIDVQGATSGEIVDLCRNLQIQPTAVLQMGHDTPNFAKDLRINGSILCNGTFSSGRNQPTGSGDGSIYLYNSRIYLNLIDDNTYVSGSGYFNPRALSISSAALNKNLIIDLYNTDIDENFAIKSDNRVNVTITHFAYIRIKGVLGLTGSDYQYSSPTAKSDLTIQGIVVTNDVSLFTKNTTPGESTSLTIANQGSLYTQKINKGILDKKTEAAGFTLTIDAGGLLRLGQGVNFDNLKTTNPNFVFNNNGELRKHYSETMPTKAQITASMDQFDPFIVGKKPQTKDVFGSSNIGGWYNFTSTNEPFLSESLDFYRTFGATSIKTVLSTINGKMFEAYSFNHTWPNFATLKEVAQNTYINELFLRDHIKTHTFWTTTKKQGDFKQGPDFNHATYLNEEQQFYDLTKHLLQTYGALDKKFVYQNWEGDWMLRGEGVAWESNPSLIPDDVDWKIEGMARLVRARQRGTERARNEFSGATAKVFYGVEYNKLWYNKMTMMDNGTPSVLGDVIPHARIDLSSWSAYDGAWTDTNNPVGHALWKGLEIARYFTTQTGDMDVNCPVQIGEFAINENPPYNPAVTEFGVRSKYGRYIGVALGLGIPNFYLWNFYCSGSQDGPAGFIWEKDTQYDTAFLYQWLDGKWLLEPDGTWGIAATFLMEQWANALSVDELNPIGQQIRLYPNPAINHLYLKGVDTNARISIFDLNGRKLNDFFQPSAGEINVSKMNKGTYIIKIENPDKSIETKKLIKN
jgi:hypothetical protein